MKIIIPNSHTQKLTQTVSQDLYQQTRTNKSIQTGLYISLLLLMQARNQGKICEFCCYACILENTI